MVYFFQINKSGDVLEWRKVPWDDHYDDEDFEDQYLKEDSCRARRHQLIFRYINLNSRKLVKSKTILGITTNKSVEDIEKCLKVLNNFEVKVGLKKTTYEKCQIPKNQFTVAGDMWNRYILTGSKLWSVAPPAHSLYTLLIRMLIEGSSGIPYNFEIGLNKLPGNTVYLNDYHEYNGICDQLIPFASNIRNIFGTSITRNYKFLEDDKYEIEWGFHELGIESFFGEEIYNDYIERVKKWQEKFKKIINNK